jgi:hypothetical protein
VEVPPAQPPSATTAPVAPPSPSPTPPTAPAAQEFKTFVKVEPADAELRVDGVVHTERPTVMLSGPPGKAFKIEVQRSGMAPQSRDIVITPEDKRVVLQLEPLAANALQPSSLSRPAETTHASANGYLTVTALPFATVVVDGKHIGSTPVLRLALKPGPHSLELRNENINKHETRTVKIEAGHHTKVPIDWSN